MAKPLAPQRRCWIDPPLPGQVNMAVDRTLLQRAEQTETPSTWVRFYGWSVPTASVGRNQSSTDLNLECCLRRSIPVVVRPTGGRAVFHFDELTYAVISNDQSVFPSHSASEAYAMIAGILRNGMARLGIETDLHTRPPALVASSLRRSKAPGPANPCFLSVARYELRHNGKKIVGSAQRRLHRSFLQHGSIPLNINFDLMGEVLKIPSDALLAAVTSVNLAAPSKVSFGTLAKALKFSFDDFLASPGPGRP